MDSLMLGIMFFVVVGELVMICVSIAFLVRLGTTTREVLKSTQESNRGIERIINDSIRQEQLTLKVLERLNQ